MKPPSHTRSQPAAVWLRNAQIAVYAFMGVVAVTGLCYLFYSAFVGHAFGALLGGICAIGGVTFGCLALAAVRFGDMILARNRGHESLQARIEALEAAFDAQGVPVDLSRVGSHDTEHLVAGNLNPDVFPRLVKSSAEPIEEASDQASPTIKRPEAPSSIELQWQAAYQNGDVAGCRQALLSLREDLDPDQAARMEEGLQAMAAARSAQLREDFARLVRLRNYEAALLTGDAIAQLFPESAMARQFQELRPHLRRRADEANAPQHAPAV